MKKKEKSTFSGSFGFVLAAAGSAVGVGNIWRFPYLAAKDGGGLFLLIYLALVLTFGFTLLTTDVAIGRRTKKHALNAFSSIDKKWGFLGVLTFLVPAIIATYYSIIGGWVTKYAFTFLTGNVSKTANENYFTSFITSKVSPIVFMLIFLMISSIIVYRGVEKGIEKFSRYIMPVLFLMIIVIAIFSLTLNFKDGNTTRNGIEGLLIYLTPNFEGMTIGKFLNITLDAMSQLFFSLSVSMGIMITYGSYVKKDVNLSKSLGQIEFFDTLVAFLAGLMIIPAVYVFFGTEGMNSGPSLMFISLPKVFQAMGPAGKWVGMLFFVMVLFAALTSSISVLEALVANCMEKFHVSRKKMCVLISSISGVLATIVCLGYNVLYFELALPNGQTGQLLDIMDYVSNSFLMPFISLLTCIFIGWVVKPSWICDEVETSGHIFRKKKLYAFMIRYVAPIMMAILFLQSTGLFSFFN